MDQKLRFLGVVAHPHDYTHFSATSGVHTALGDQFTVVCMTTGAGTHNVQLSTELAKPPSERDPAIVNQAPEDYAASKADELRAAAALFGVTDVRMLGFPDKPFILAEHRDAIDRLKEIIREVRPHVMITQSPYTGSGSNGRSTAVHNDHVETGAASIEAKSAAGLAKHGDTQALHTIPLTLFPGVYFEPPEIDFYIDTSAWHEQRVQAEAQYASQGQSPAFARKRVEVGAGHTGWAAGTLYAEGFVREGAELQSRIVISEQTLQKALDTEAQHLDKLVGAATPGS